MIVKTTIGPLAASVSCLWRLLCLCTAGWSIVKRSWQRRIEAAAAMGLYSSDNYPSAFSWGPAGLIRGFYRDQISLNRILRYAGIDWRRWTWWPGPSFRILSVPDGCYGCYCSRFNSSGADCPVHTAIYTAKERIKHKVERKPYMAIRTRKNYLQSLSARRPNITNWQVDWPMWTNPSTEAYRGSHARSLMPHMIALLSDIFTTDIIFYRTKRFCGLTPWCAIRRMSLPMPDQNAPCTVWRVHARVAVRGMEQSKRPLERDWGSWSGMRHVLHVRLEKMD